jgi:peptidase E
MVEKKKRVPKAKRQIVAIGGGLTPEAVINYLLNLSGKPNPKVLFINTATGDHPDSLMRAYQRFAALGCRPSHLPLFARTPLDLEELLLLQDVIWVGGGNTKTMLAVWREYGIDKNLGKAWKQGVILSGSSAGGICWFEGCCTDSYAVNYIALPALGFLKGSCCPHYDGEPGRPETYQNLIKGEELADGLAIDEGVAVHFIGNKLHEVLTAKEGTGAYTVAVHKGKIVQEKLPVRLITL